MEEIERIFNEYKNYSTSKEYETLFSLLKENYGKKVNTKEENGYIDIEYNNRMGEYKAKLLIKYFDRNKDFYQFFLKKVNKVVIGSSESKKDVGEYEIFIDNYPNDFDTSIILEQILKQYKGGSEYCSMLASKVDDNKQFLSKDDNLVFTHRLLLEEILKIGKIDNYTYLDLVEGKFINLGLYYQRAIIDIAFEYGYYGWLDIYMRGNEQEVVEIKKYIYLILYEKYSLDLFNDLLGKQLHLLENGSKKLESDFIKDNLPNLINLFQIEIPKFWRKYKKEDFNNREQVRLSKDDLVALVKEFLKEIDDTNQLVQEFSDNLDNGTIILWDKNNEEERIKMENIYSKFHNSGIYEPACLSTYDDNFKVSNIIVNVPLSNQLDDASSIVHEFFHLHNALSSGIKGKNKLLSEFSSVYFEELFKNFLIKKGYNSNDVNTNFRIIDALGNFSLVLPVLNYLNAYIKSGSIDMNFMYNMVDYFRETVAYDCNRRELSDEEREKEFERQGLFKTDEQLIREAILNLNVILSRYKQSMFLNTPYLLGVVLANAAMENNCDVNQILKISGDLNNIEDVISVMNDVGMDVGKYGFSIASKKSI